MKTNLIASKSIEINASTAKIWAALTIPEKIKVYLYGTETITDWAIGSPIIFQGEYQGQTYKDKGNVLQNIENQLLQYSYWSGFSGTEDKPENYSTITYLIEQLPGKKVKFTWTQEGFSSEENQQHSESGLGGLLEGIKKLAEEG